MTTEPGILVLTSLVFLIVYYIDNTGERADPSSKRKTIDSALFSSYHRRMAIYFVSMLVFPIGIVLYTWSDFWSEPLIYIGLYFFSFLVVSLVSVFYAGNRDRRLKRSELSD